MKRICQVIVMLGMMLTLSRQVVFAETGSLKINVEISNTTTAKEQTFFEQDATLKQLFNASLSQTIKKQQTEESLSQQKDKALLFLSKEPQKLNPIDNSTLFLSQTTIASTQRITLRDGQENSLITVGFVLFGMVISGISIYQLLKKRKEHHAKDTY